MRALAWAIGTKRAYFAYDTPDDLEPLIEAGKMMREAGFTIQSHALACYCLIGYRGDTFERAEKRLFQAVAAGFVPYAMLYRDDQGETDPQWRKFQREWLRPQIVTTKMREVCGYKDLGRVVDLLTRERMMQRKGEISR